MRILRRVSISNSHIANEATCKTLNRLQHTRIRIVCMCLITVVRKDAEVNSTLVEKFVAAVDRLCLSDGPQRVSVHQTPRHQRSVRSGVIRSADPTRLPGPTCSCCCCCMVPRALNQHFVTDCLFCCFRSDVICHPTSSRCPPNGTDDGRVPV